MSDADQVRWGHVAERLGTVVGAPEVGTAKRMAWLRRHLRREGGESHVAGGSALAGEILAAVLLTPTAISLEALLEPQIEYCGRERFRIDFAMCALTEMHRAAKGDDLAWPVEQLRKLQGLDLLTALLECLAYEISGVIDWLNK